MMSAPCLAAARGSHRGDRCANGVLWGPPGPPDPADRTAAAGKPLSVCLVYGDKEPFLYPRTVRVQGTVDLRLRDLRGGRGTVRTRGQDRKTPDSKRLAG